MINPISQIISPYNNKLRPSDRRPSRRAPLSSAPRAV
jgi:hypothetical protein